MLMLVSWQGICKRNIENMRDASLHHFEFSLIKVGINFCFVTVIVRQLHHMAFCVLAYKTVLHSYGLDSNPSSEEEEEEDDNSDLEVMDVRY